MPRYVDHAARRRDIMKVAIELLAEHGPRGISFRAISDRLGGSTTMVTHYYPTQQDLVDEVAIRVVDGWSDDIAKLEADASDPTERLMVLLTWLVPTSVDGLREERMRINLLSDQIIGQEHRNAFAAWDTKIRAMLRDHVQELVPAGDVSRVVELLRVCTNGLVLSVLENADGWPAERQLAVLDHLLASLGLRARPRRGRARKSS